MINGKKITVVLPAYNAAKTLKMLGTKLSEYHTGYRAFTKEVLMQINYHSNSDDFVFDNQVISQVIYHGFEDAAITCPTSYFQEASSINFNRSLKYGLGVIKVSIEHVLQKHRLVEFKYYSQGVNAPKLDNKKLKVGG